MHRALGVPRPLSLGTRPVPLPSEHMKPMALSRSVKAAPPQVAFQGGGWNVEGGFPHFLPQGLRQRCRSTPSASITIAGGIHVLPFTLVASGCYPDLLLV